MAITCNCPGKCLIHPKYDNVTPIGNTATDVIPQLESEDKLTLKTLEAESLKAQIQMEQTRQQVMQRALAAHQQLEQFTAAMFEKHNLKQTEWLLDLSKLEFIRRDSK